MIDYAKNYSLENIKNKLVVVYILNVTDIIFTLLLLSTGFYMEANIFMVKAVESIPSSFLLKVVLPAIMFTFIYFRIRNATEQQLKKSNILINGVLIIYALINVSHLVWFALIPVFS
jgi:hypothetical protein